MEWLCETCKFYTQDWTCNNKKVLKRLTVLADYHDGLEMRKDFGCRFWEF